MGRTTKTPVVWTEGHDKGAFIAIWTPQGNQRMFDTAADISPALGRNAAFPGNAFPAQAGNKASADDMHADEPISEKSTNDEQNSDGNQVDHDSTIVRSDSIMKPSNSIVDATNPKSKAEYRGPMDEESARARVGDALYLFKWNLPAHNEKYESSHTASSTGSRINLSSRPPSHGPSELSGMALNHGEARNRPSNLAAISGIKVNSLKAQKTSPSSTLSSHESSGFKDPHQTVVEGQVAANPTDSRSTPATVSVTKLRACTRCRKRRIGCNRGAPCANCIRAGVQCMRPLQSAQQ